MPRPRLSLTTSYDDATIDALRDRLHVARTLVPGGYERYFVRRARYRSVHTSTAIEGNQLGEQLALLVLVESAGEGDPHAAEVRNLGEAYELVQQIADDRSTRVDEGLIRAMNSVLLKDAQTPEARTRGRYRAGTSLIVDSRTGEVRYRPPSAEVVPDLMASFVADVQQWIDAETYSGPVAAALAHFGLVSIHPFGDGNGRTARLLADMVLQRTGWAADGMLSVSSAILASQQDYYGVLRETQGEDFGTQVDATPFVEFHTSMLVRAAQELEQGANALRRRLAGVANLASRRMNSRQELAFMFMLDIAPISTTVYAELAETSPSSALADLNEMVERGWVVREGKGRNTRYRVEPGLDEKLRVGEA